MTLSRIIVAMVATLALAAPTALAQPPDMHASTAIAAAKERATQQQDLRSPDARDAATRPQYPGRAAGPTWPAHPKPVSPPSQAPATVAHTDGGSDVDWTAIGIGLALSFSVLGGVVALTARSRTLQRKRAVA
jgi:hypothetical protein